MCNVNIRYPHKEAGQIPMAYVVRKAESNIAEKQVMDFIAGQVCFENFLTMALFLLMR